MATSVKKNVNIQNQTTKIYLLLHWICCFGHRKYEIQHNTGKVRTITLKKAILILKTPLAVHPAS